MATVVSRCPAFLPVLLILFSATRLYKVLGQPFLVAIERLMGMLLVAISVQMLMDGITATLRLPHPAA